jgi:hypothetical protein
MKKIESTDAGVCIQVTSRSDLAAPGRKRSIAPLGRAASLASALLVMLLSGPLASAQTSPPFSDFKSYVDWVQKNHKAPFSRDGVVRSNTSAKTMTISPHMEANKVGNGHPTPDAAMETEAAAKKHRSVKVNQDRNPWQKVGIAVAVDPRKSSNLVVMSNDFRDNFERIFYHVSTDNGKTWTDDSMINGSDFVTGGAPLAFQRNPEISFDDTGNTFLAHLTGNAISYIPDPNEGYQNFDTEVDVVQGFGDGTYLSQTPIPLDVQRCGGILGFGAPNSCDAVLDMPGVKTDHDENSPNNGTTYVYYTLMCNFPMGNSCTDFGVSVGARGSAILEQDNGTQSPFLPSSFSGVPRLVSGSHGNAQFSDMVIDAAGTPHIFFDDFSDPFMTTIWESTLTNGVWIVSDNAVATFMFETVGNVHWRFGTRGSMAPGCGIHVNTAYCAFAANFIPGGKNEDTASIYLATVDTTIGTSQVTRVNNDPLGNLKDHFFPWATATPAGDVYVGWYDDRNDPFNTDIQYFVAKSTDGGKTFPTQKPISELFNPCVGVPDCAYFGDYNQLVSGPDGVVHAAWADTRDGVSMQIYSEAITW